MATYTRTITTQGWPAGLAASLRYTVVSTVGGEVRVARTGTGITADGVATGVYNVSVAGWDDDWGEVRVVWDDGSTGAAVETLMPVSGGGGDVEVDITESDIEVNLGE